MAQGNQAAKKAEQPAGQAAPTPTAPTLAVVAKPKAVVEKIKMTDGREVDFAGKRKMLKAVVINRENNTVAVRFDFRNGETRNFQVPSALALDCAGHGASQKIGDETAGEDDIDDMVIAVDAIIKRLAAGDWSAEREAGDGFSGASVVIKAIVEVSGKSVEDVKTFLDKKLADDKARGGKLTRATLYASFRNPTSKTGQVIERLEREKKSKNNAVDADALLGELA